MLIEQTTSGSSAAATSQESLSAILDRDDHTHTKEIKEVPALSAT
jgi:hypothetical protein